MKADLSKVPFQDDELAAVKSLTDVVDEVFAQAGPEDEEVGVDADDFGEIIMKGFAPGSAAARYVTGGGSKREMLRRTKNVFYGVERAYDLVGSVGADPV